ncbi:MAG: trypsin-like peptidase domain-containing protein [Akkermansiaceae bacterium]|nr:trypsin-like peptidase domain-containing protein [Verrucomicrobiae bacterium]MCP5553422.1 trypsin-like peptidase domain-containing protein [Akkermansiaceae bacterium]
MKVPCGPCAVVLVLLLTGCWSLPVLAQSPRETPTVALARKAGPAVVAVFSEGEGKFHSGSGTLIHPDGYILTNDHVVQNRPGQVLLQDGSIRPYRLIGRVPEKDLAVILIPSPQPLPVLPLGRSADLLAGEPVLVAGNPGGRGIVFSSGIVSSPSMLMNAPNALVMAHFANDVRDRFIQFDAASNPGNSGGPLINAEGRLIGVVSAANPGEQNIGFAIPADRVRSEFLRLVSPEERWNFWFGIGIDPLAMRAEVISVAKGAPAESAGLVPGDVLLQAGAKPLDSGLDWILSLVNGRSGVPLTMRWERKGTIHQADLVAQPYPVLAAVAREGLKPGARFKAYELKKPDRLPDFGMLKPVREGIAKTLSPRVLEPTLPAFGLVIEGLLDLPEGGLVRLLLESDDGSRLYWHGRPVIDNDGPHPPQTVGRLLRVAAGPHPVRLEYFEASGGSQLNLWLEKEDGTRTELTSERWFHIE